jgi:hypothetical protein
MDDPSSEEGSITNTNSTNCVPVSSSPAHHHYHNDHYNTNSHRHANGHHGNGNGNGSIDNVVMNGSSGNGKAVKVACIQLSSTLDRNHRRALSLIESAVAAGARLVLLYVYHYIHLTHFMDSYYEWMMIIMIITDPSCLRMDGQCRDIYGKLQSTDNPIVKVYYLCRNVLTGWSNFAVCCQRQVTLIMIWYGTDGRYGWVVQYLNVMETIFGTLLY